MQPGRLRPGNVNDSSEGLIQTMLQCSRGVSAPETCRPSRPCRHRSPGFNAAGASPPRKPEPAARRGARPFRRFNAAGASPPRKLPVDTDAASLFEALQCSRGVSAPETLSDSSPGRPLLDCFNAAGASPPRKRRRRLALGRAGAHASMQPGRLRPGNSPRRRSIAPSRGLQCSRGVSAPETDVAMVGYVDGLVKLQCSRGVSAPETRHDAGAERCAVPASMQPGRLRPGNAVRHEQPASSRGVASMQPGRLRPGNMR